MNSEQGQIVQGEWNYFILRYWDPVKNFKKESDMVKFEFWEMERGLEGAKEKAGRLVRRLLWLPRRQMMSLTTVVVPEEEKRAVPGVCNRASDRKIALPQTETRGKKQDGCL